MNRRYIAIAERAVNDSMVAHLAAASLRASLAPGLGQRDAAIVKALDRLQLPVPGGKRWMRIRAAVKRLQGGVR